MPQTMAISSAVGTTWKTTELSTKEIPLRERTANASDDRSVLAQNSPRARDDALGASVDRPCQTASLARQVEAEVHREKVLKRLAGHLADRFLGNRRKKSVAQLGEQGRHDACGAVCRATRKQASISMRQSSGNGKR
jgi:hypothetical protein